MATQAIATLIQECSKGRSEGLHTDAEAELLALRRAAKALESMSMREYVATDPEVRKALALLSRIAKD